MGHGAPGMEHREWRKRTNEHLNKRLVKSERITDYRQHVSDLRTSDLLFS